MFGEWLFVSVWDPRRPRWILDSQYVGPSSVGKYVGLSVWRSSLPVNTYVGPSVAWMDNGSVDLHQYAARSVRRVSESMCGAIRGLDGHSICGALSPSASSSMRCDF